MGVMTGQRNLLDFRHLRYQAWQTRYLNLPRHSQVLRGQLEGWVYYLTNVESIDGVTTERG